MQTVEQCSNPDYFVVKFIGNNSPSWEGKVADVPAEIVQRLRKRDADGLEMVVVHWQSGGSVAKWNGVLVGAQPLYGRIGDPIDLPVVNVRGRRKQQLSKKAELEKRQQGICSYSIILCIKFVLQGQISFE